MNAPFAEYMYARGWYLSHGNPYSLFRGTLIIFIHADRQRLFIVKTETQKRNKTIFIQQRTEKKPPLQR